MVNTKYYSFTINKNRFIHNKKDKTNDYITVIRLT